MTKLSNATDEDHWSGFRFPPLPKPLPVPPDSGVLKQREWVGLTRREFDEATSGLEDLEDCWIAIEAKLKERNE